MSKIKMYLDVVNELRSLADSIEVLAQAMADGDNMSKPAKLKSSPSPSVMDVPDEAETEKKEREDKKLTIETIRTYAAEISRDNADNKSKIVGLLKKYKAKNVSTIPKDKYEDFYADLKQIAEGGD